MKVGLYFDLRVPPGSGLDPARVYAHTLEMCEEAERAGIDSVWFSEHHGFADSYLPQPLTMAAAAAARTRRIRLGTALVVAPLHHPAEIAEQAAVVDLISGGRLDLGMGAGYRQPEFDLFGRSRDRRFAATVDTAQEIRRLWAEGAVTPAPVQERLPIWLGLGGQWGARRAGRLGEGLLLIMPSALAAYREGLAEGGHPASAERVAAPLFAWASPDPDRDWCWVRERIAYQQDSYRRHMADGTDDPVTPFDPEKARERPFDRPPYFWVDTPETIAKRAGESLGDVQVDTVFLWGSIGGMSEAETERTVQTVCREVAPLLRSLPSP